MSEYYADQTRKREAAERAQERERADRLRADKVKKEAEAGWPGCGR
jgi:hypothetical protein